MKNEPDFSEQLAQEAGEESWGECCVCGKSLDANSIAVAPKEAPGWVWCQYRDRPRCVACDAEENSAIIESTELSRAMQSIASNRTPEEEQALKEMYDKQDQEARMLSDQDIDFMESRDRGKRVNPHCD